MTPAQPAALAWTLAALLAGAAVAAGPPAAAARQQAPAPTSPPASQQPAPTFKSSVDVVLVDVNVVSRNTGRPLDGLQPEDFQVTVDGKPRRIKSAQFVATRVPRESQPAVPSTPAYTSNEADRGGRLVMLIVDTGHIAPGYAKRVFMSAAKFVESLNPQDRVALTSIPTGPQIDFTRNHDLVRAQLEKMDGQPLATAGVRTVTVAEALGFERRDQAKIDRAAERECGAAPSDTRANGGDFGLCFSQLRQEAQVLAAETHGRARATISALKGILGRLGSNDTPKALVFLSEGLVIDGEPGELTWLAGAAAAAHVTLYALQINRGDADASTARVPASRMADRMLQHEGLATMAGLARGDVFQIVASPDLAFERVANELSAYYLLGFEPEPEERDGKPHKIKVEVNREGVSVRWRPEFSMTPVPARSPEVLLIESLQSPLPATAIPLSVSTYTVQEKPPKVKVIIAAEASSNDALAGGGMLGFLLLDQKGQTSAGHVEKLEPGPAGRGPQAYVVAAEVDPGVYTLKMAMVGADGRAGSVERTFAAKLTTFERIRASDLFLADGGGSTAAGATPGVSAKGEIASGALHAALQLVADTPDALNDATVAIEVAAAGSRRPLNRVLAQASGTGTQRTVEATVPLLHFPPGEYLARALVSIGDRQVGEVERPFHIK